MPRVSVIIPTHNRPEYLARALASVQAQTMPDFEVFVVDDGSPDDRAAEVVRACNDPRIHYIRLPEPRGPAAARNAGILRSTAPYIAFLDDDDEWLPEKLEVQLPVLESSTDRVGVAYTGRLTLSHASLAPLRVERAARFDPRRAENIVTTSSVLVRRQCFISAGVFDEQLFGCEDFDMWLRIGALFDFVCIDKPLVKYLMHSGGITYDDARKAPSLELLLSKHRLAFRRDRRGQCGLYLALHAKYVRLGDPAKARKALWRSFKIWPFEPRVYKALWRYVRRQTPTHYLIIRAAHAFDPRRQP